MSGEKQRSAMLLLQTAMVIIHAEVAKAGFASLLSIVDKLKSLSEQSQDWLARVCFVGLPNRVCWLPMRSAGTGRLAILRRNNVVCSKSRVTVQCIANSPTWQHRVTDEVVPREAILRLLINGSCRSKLH